MHIHTYVCILFVTDVCFICDCKIAYIHIHTYITFFTPALTDIVPEFSRTDPVETVTISNGLVAVYTQVMLFPNSLFVYDLEVEFTGSTNRTSTDAITDISDSCVILLLQGVSVVGASEIVRM